MFWTFGFRVLNLFRILDFEIRIFFNRTYDAGPYRREIEYGEVLPELLGTTGLLPRAPEFSRIRLQKCFTALPFGAGDSRRLALKPCFMGRFCT